MGDEDHAAAEVLQELFQPGDGLDVQVVGGFVQQQQVGRRDERLGQQHAPLHAARQRRELGVLGQVELADDLFDALFDRPAVAGLDAGLHGAQLVHVDVHAVVQHVVVAGQVGAQLAQAHGHHVEDAAAEVLGHLLRQAGDAAFAGKHAVVGHELARQQPQQGGFTGAVAADDANALVALDRQVHGIEQERAADAVVDALE